MRCKVSFLIALLAFMFTAQIVTAADCDLGGSGLGYSGVSFGPSYLSKGTQIHVNIGSTLGGGITTRVTINGSQVFSQNEPFNGFQILSYTLQKSGDTVVNIDWANYGQPA